jgi:hypothetical protein
VSEAVSIVDLNEIEETESNALSLGIFRKNLDILILRAILKK